MKTIELLFDKENAGAGVTAISLVEHPAILVDWVAFSKDGVSQSTNFKFADEDKHIILGPAMIPGMRIPRIDERGEEYEVFYNADTVQQLSQHFLKSGKQASATLEHEMTLNGITVVESWIIEDPTHDKSAAYGFTLPKGTWMISMKVDDGEVWSAVKDGRIKGFSIEAFLENKVVNQSLNFSMLKTKIKELYEFMVNGSSETTEETTEAKTFGSVAVTDSESNAVELIFPGDVLEVGSEVRTMNEEGEEVAAMDGVYTDAEAGRSITVANGEVVEINEIEQEEPEAEMEQIEQSEEVETPELATKQDLETLKNQISEVLEKFSATLDEKFEKTETSVKNLREEMSVTPASEPIPNTPSGELQNAPARSFAELKRKMKNKK